MVTSRLQSRLAPDRIVSTAAALAVLAATGWLAADGSNPAVLTISGIAGAALLTASLGPTRGTTTGTLFTWMAIGCAVALGLGAILGSLAGWLYLAGAVLAGLALVLAPPDIEPRKLQPRYVIAQAVAFGLTAVLVTLS